MNGFNRLRLDDDPLRSRGRHRSYDQQVERMYFSRGYPRGSDFEERLRLYRETNVELQTVIGDAIRLGKRFRAQGSEWSSSEVGLARDWLLNTRRLQGLRASLSSGSLARASFAQRPLRFIESGESIRHINRYLTSQKLSLQTSGSNNGQTLAGVLSTGTHGSAHDFGSTLEFVHGLHLITGPTRNIYVQRASSPIVNSSFTDRLGAELVENDSAFNAALVAFGAFGIIRGVMIEARELFTLHATRFFHPFDDRVRGAIDTGDISNLDFTLADEEFPQDVVQDNALHHLQVYFNPNDMENSRPREAAVLVMFEDQFDETYEEPEWDDDGPGPAAGAVEFVQALLRVLPRRLTRPVISGFIRNFLGSYYRLGTIEDLFGGLRPEEDNLLTGTAVPRSRALEALDLVFKEYESFRRVMPLIVTARFVKATEALLGFTRFDPTCVIDIDGPSSERSRDFVKRVWKKFQGAGIPFTVHWGKLEKDLEEVLRVSDSSLPVSTMYGQEAVATWRQHRNDLLESESVAQVFTNGFMERIGLV